MEQKIIQIGNSTGIIIPKALLEEAGLSSGMEVIVQKDPISGDLAISKKGKTGIKHSISRGFLEILERVNDQYGSALRELAQK